MKTRRPPTLALLFLLVALPCGLFAALTIPTGEVPDEVAHVLRAGSLLGGEVVGRRMQAQDSAGNPVADAGLFADRGLYAAGAALPGGAMIGQKKLTPGRLAALQEIPWEGARSLIHAPNTASYLPVFYLPATAGLALAQHQHLRPFDAIRLARVCMLVAYVGLGFAALVLARRGRGLIFATLVLPMALWLAASINPDGLLLASAALAAALLGRPERRAFWAVAILLALVIAAKPFYLPLALALVGPGLAKGWRRCAAGLAVAVLPVLLWSALALRFATVPFITAAPYVAGPLFRGPAGQVFTTTNPAAQIAILLHPPTRLILLPWASFWAGLAAHLREVVGVLGTLDLLLPPWLEHLGYLALGAAMAGCLLAPREADAPPLWHAALGLLGIIGAIFAIYLVEYITWTLVGQAQIDGVQGRYFLPLLPLLAVAIPALGPRRFAPALAALLAAPTLALGFGALVALPLLISTTYYLH